MPLTESIVEDAALEWFGELGYAVGHGPHMSPGGPGDTLTPALSQRERVKTCTPDRPRPSGEREG